MKRMLLVGVLSLSIFAIGASAAPATVAPAKATSSDCSCVTYVRDALAAHAVNLPGGPGTAGGYQETWMDQHGWHRVVPPGSGTIPSGGKAMVMVWDANKKSAYGDGHMAIVATAWAQQAGLTQSGLDPWYNSSSEKWNIKVLQEDWPVGQCGVTQTTFTGWGDLDGINFYIPN
jgi:hypothetical protein